MPCVASGSAFFWRHSTLCGETSASPKKKKKSTLCTRLQTRCNKGTPRCALMLRWCAPRGGAGRGRKRLFPAANRSVSERNTQGAALRQISLPINWHGSFYSVIYFNACSSGGDAGSRGVRGEPGSEAGDGWDSLLGRAISKIGCISITRHKINNSI